MNVLIKITIAVAIVFTVRKAVDVMVERHLDKMVDVVLAGVENSIDNSFDLGREDDLAPYQDIINAKGDIFK